MNILKNLPYEIIDFNTSYFYVNEDAFCIDKLVKVLPKNIVLPKTYEKYAAAIYNFKPKVNDIWLMGYPRSGTTLLQEILYLLGTDFDYEKASNNIMDDRFPLLEMPAFKNSYNVVEIQFFGDALDKLYERLEKVEGIRFIKSHLPFSLHNPDIFNIGCKVIYIARHPLDVFVSFSYFPTWKKNISFEEKWKATRDDSTIFNPYFVNLLEAWDSRHNENLLFIFYEKLIKNKRETIQIIADFLGKTIERDQLDVLLEHVEIRNFKGNKSLNNGHLVASGVFVKNDQFTFIRKGKAGSWKQHFVGKLRDEANEWMRKHLEGTDFIVPDEWKN